jgi:hypothetical protein
MEHSPPHYVHFTLMVRSDDLGQFYGRIVGVTTPWGAVTDTLPSDLAVRHVQFN